MSGLPPELAALFAEVPLPDAEKQARALSGDLEAAERSYRKQGQEYGDQDRWWEVWRAIVQARGRTLHAGIEGLSAQGRRWYAKWALGSGEREDEGLLAYRRYLDRPGKTGPFAAETCEYLRRLAARGRHAEVLATADEVEAKVGDARDEQLAAARSCLALGDRTGARARADRVRQRHDDCAEAWAASAIVAAAEGDRERALPEARQALARGLLDGPVLGELEEALDLPELEWQSLLASRPPAPPSTEEQRRLWLADPGARLRPSPAPTPHWYGGDEFEMPPCRGCGHPIRQWFVLDLREIPPLRARLPGWALFPLLGCADCMVWMGRHDYVLDATGRRVTLENVAISVTEYGQPFGTVPPLPHQYARLEWIAPVHSPTQEQLDAVPACGGEPLVAGTPLWTQNPERPFCRRCGEEMVFVAALSTTEAFQPIVPINNESGYQYHFACDRCRTLAVIAQWT